MSFTDKSDISTENGSAKTKNMKEISRGGNEDLLVKPWARAKDQSVGRRFGNGPTPPQLRANVPNRQKIAELDPHRQRCGLVERVFRTGITDGEDVIRSESISDVAQSSRLNNAEAGPQP